MEILKLVERIFIKIFICISIIPLQSCSNTLIGEKLENSFDVNTNSISSQKSINGPETTNRIKKIESNKKITKKENKNDFEKIIKKNSVSNKDSFIKKSTKSKKKIIFNPQPYRIILRLTRANPSAPAESLTEALRKADIQFEVEKIERLDESNLSKSTSLKR